MQSSVFLMKLGLVQFHQLVIYFLDSSLAGLQPFSINCLYKGNYEMEPCSTTSKTVRSPLEFPNKKDA